MEYIDLRQMFFIVLKKLPIIIAGALVCAVLAFLYSTFLITPMYSSTASLCVQANENRGDYKSVTTADFTVSADLVNTISELAKNDVCIKAVGESTGLDKVYSPAQIRSMLQIISNGTENFSVKATCPNPEYSLILVNAFANVISDSTFVDGNIVSANANDPYRGYVKKILKAGTVTLISNAKSVPLAPSSPNKARNVLLAALLGAIVCAGFFVIRESFSMKIITEDDIASRYQDIPALGTVPLVTVHEGRERHDNAEKSKN